MHKQERTCTEWYFLRVIFTSRGEILTPLLRPIDFVQGEQFGDVGIL